MKRANENKNHKLAFMGLVVFAILGAILGGLTGVAVGFGIGIVGLFATLALAMMASRRDRKKLSEPKPD